MNKIRWGFAAIMLLNFMLFIGGSYVAGSLIANGIKAATHECGQTYGIESIVNGNWFCSTK